MHILNRQYFNSPSVQFKASALEFFSSQTPGFSFSFLYLMASFCYLHCKFSSYIRQMLWFQWMYPSKFACWNWNPLVIGLRWDPFWRWQSRSAFCPQDWLAVLTKWLKWRRFSLLSFWKIGCPFYLPYEDNSKVSIEEKQKTKQNNKQTKNKKRVAFTCRHLDIWLYSFANFKK